MPFLFALSYLRPPPERPPPPPDERTEPPPPPLYDDLLLLPPLYDDDDLLLPPLYDDDDLLLPPLYDDLLPLPLCLDTLLDAEPPATLLVELPEPLLTDVEFPLDALALLPLLLTVLFELSELLTTVRLPLLLTTLRVPLVAWPLVPDAAFTVVTLPVRELVLFARVYDLNERSLFSAAVYCDTLPRLYLSCAATLRVFMLLREFVLPVRTAVFEWCSWRCS